MKCKQEHCHCDGYTIASRDGSYLFMRCALIDSEGRDGDGRVREISIERSVKERKDDIKRLGVTFLAHYCYCLVNLNRSSVGDLLEKKGENLNKNEMQRDNVSETVSRFETGLESDRIL